MARPKRHSDEMHNARNRAKRLATRLEKQGNVAGAQRLRDTVAQSYGKSASVNLSDLNNAVSAYRASKAAPVGKVPRPKRQSDELYNARRRLRRQAEKIEREAASQKGSAKDIALGFANYLRQQAQATGKLDAGQTKAALERLGRIRDATKGATYEAFKIRRRNTIFMQQLNAAGTEGATSAISERKKDVFWAATKGLWPKGSNVSRNDRYDMILQHFYSDNTTDAREFREWLKTKGTTAQDSYGDLQLVFEYLTEELNDPEQYDMPEVPYEQAMDLIRTAM